MSDDPKLKQATGEVGAYLLAQYRDERKRLRAADAASALGGLAGIFAQIQARAMMQSGAIKQTETTLAEVTTQTGERYYFGDAINAVLLDGAREAPSFWNLAGGAARDAKIGDKIDVLEIAKRATRDVGSPKFGQPLVVGRYKLSETPLQAVRAHGPWFLARFLEMGLEPPKLMWVFGSVAQSFAPFAAGEVKDLQPDVSVMRVDLVRIYMEAAVPMSKMDLRTVGMAIEP
ncbi:hypothetical protein [Candidatus Viadribacter manganicus]|uniref:Uncharacterized protein n=1 Tax=Candidatus Viadribacter manganicus TaxID=1759059 RepID=A0A1B1AK85_9PROT|nr:hypothetical protein [Candidatus Viadribacter manganicus]ANP46986.1 hypothetical protein ATE48_14215 [Candidatus Viadribacter manganicus]